MNYAEMAFAIQSQLEAVHGRRKAQLLDIYAEASRAQLLGPESASTDALALAAGIELLANHKTTFFDLLRIQRQADEAAGFNF